MNQEAVRHTLNTFRAKHRKSTFLYSVSSVFYAIPAIGLMYNYDACVKALSGNIPLINLMITQLIVQCPLSYLNDTYSLWKYATFETWYFWSYVDVSSAVMTFCTQLIMTPMLCDTHFENVLYFGALFLSLGFFALARFASHSKYFTTNSVYKWIWCMSHFLWHALLPFSCTYVIVV